MAWPTVPTHGRLARVTVAGTAIDYTSDWALNWSRDVATVQRQGQDYKDSFGGQAGFTVSLNGPFVNSSELKSMMALAISTQGATAYLGSTGSTVYKFCFDTTANAVNFPGGLVLSGMNINAAVGDVIRASYTFTGSGPAEFSS